MNIILFLYHCMVGSLANKPYIQTFSPENQHPVSKNIKIEKQNFLQKRKLKIFVKEKSLQLKCRIKLL